MGLAFGVRGVLSELILHDLEGLTAACIPTARP